MPTDFRLPSLARLPSLSLNESRVEWNSSSSSSSSPHRPPAIVAATAQAR